MQTHYIPVGRNGGCTRVVLTPEGVDPTNGNQCLALSFEVGLSIVKAFGSGKTAHIFVTDITGVRHMAEAWSEVLRVMEEAQQKT